MSIIKIKAKAKGGKTDVKMMAKHEMETGQRKGSDGNLIPAKYIQHILVKHAGNVVFEANLGTAVSKNPYLAFAFAGGASGDQLEVTWTENTGETATETDAIS